MTGAPRPPPRRLHFAYGGNMSLRQMANRCPESYYLGRGVLADHSWQINERGYANLVPSVGSCVHGLVYELGPASSASSSSEDDEARLDRSEGVHSGAYSKETCCTVTLYPARRIKTARAVALLEAGAGLPRERRPARAEENVLVYMTSVFVQPGSPRGEYVDRMNVGIYDACVMGVPLEYFEKVVRPWIPHRPEAVWRLRVAAQTVAESSRAASSLDELGRVESVSLGNERRGGLEGLESADVRRQPWMEFIGYFDAGRARMGVPDGRDSRWTEFVGYFGTTLVHTENPST